MNPYIVGWERHPSADGIYWFIDHGLVTLGWLDADHIYFDLYEVHGDDVWEVGAEIPSALSKHDGWWLRIHKPNPSSLEVRYGE